MMAVAALNWCLVDFRDGRHERIHMSEGTEVWRECMRWMEEVGVLDRPFVQSATMMEFCAALRDGVILCRLVDVLIPGVIEGVTLKASSQFSCLKNITHFVDACRVHFSMREEDVFEPIEMYNLSNFLKVLNVLSMMSYSEISIRHGLVPFPRRGDSPGAHTPTSNSSFTGCMDFPPPRQFRVISPTETEEAIYQALPDRVDEMGMDEKIYDSMHLYQNMKDDSEEKVYDVIVKKALSESEFDRGDDPATARYLSFNPVSKRDHVIKEILDTEQNYVEKGLNMISKRFHAPLTNVLKDDDHRVIFMNIAELWSFHSSFYAQLREAVFHTLGITERGGGDERPRAFTVGDVFLMNKHKFTLYAPYCQGLDDSRARILQLEKNDSAVRQRIQECCATLNSQQFKLQDLLCLPMQRVLKYHLLLRELLKDTKPGHPEFHSLDSAREAMEDVNTYVNELKRDMEMKATVEEIERSIMDLQMPDKWKLIDYGREHKDGEVKLAELTSSSSSGKFKPRYCFLFDKVLIVCKANRSNTYTYKGAYIVTELRPERESHSVLSNGNGTLNTLGGTIKKLQSGYVLTLTRTINNACDREAHDTVRTIQMSFKNESQKQAWAEAFRMARENAMPSVGMTGHSVHYTTFVEQPGEEWPPCCAVCRNYLKGMFFQGYKCDRCKRPFHRECLTLEKCGASKRISQSSSFSSVSSLNSAVDPRRLISVTRGEQVAARCRVQPVEEGRLAFEKDDILEILQVHGNMMATACHATNRARAGLVSLEHVRKVQFRSNSSAGLGGLGGAGGGSHGSAMAGVIVRKQSVALPDRPAPSVISPMDDYVNTEVTAQEWFLGELSREESESRLRATANGTYLVRFSPKKQQYVISISYGGEVKHTVIENPANALFFLDETTTFPSIVELINYYREHNLRESFNALDTKLTKPHRECKTFKANHDYKASEPKFLELRVGDVITLVDTMGEERGWWKGRIGDRVGFFPLSYVEPTQ